MKLKENPVNIVRTEDFKETSFGIRDKRDLVHIFNILRSKMYSNKILAVLREYSTNAVDAHVLAGTPTKPFKVKLPTDYEPYLEIRDFGPGLTDQEIREIYCMYGASTKRHSNDYNGQLGFGSKSAFAYGDSFQITSYKDGTESIYEAYLDESQLGAIALLQKKTTQEPNGIKITIPVLQTDVTSFQTTAKELYKYFSPQPEINIIELERPEYDLKGKDWGLKLSSYAGYGYRYGSGYGPMAVMGNVAYPIRYETLSTHLKSDKKAELKYILESRIDLIFDIGELSISASRESLEYDTSTIRAIEKKCLKVIAELIKLLNEKVDNCQDIVEAKKLYLEIFKRNYHLARLCGLTGLVWNGQKITTPDFFVPDHLIKDKKVSFTKTTRTYSPRYNSSGKHNVSTYHCNQYQSFIINDEELFLIKDTNDLANRRKKTAALDLKYNNVWCFDFADDKAKEEFFKETMIPEKYFGKLSDYEPAAQVSSPRTTSNKKYNTKVFKLNQNPPVASSRTSSAYWSAHTVDLKNDKYTYIVIDYFEPVGLRGLHSINMSRQMNALDQLLGTSYKESLVAIKPKIPISKLGKGAKHLRDDVKEKLEEKLKDEKFAKALWIYSNAHPNIKDNIYKSELSRIKNKNSPAYKLWEAYNEELKDLSQGLEVAFKIITIRGEDLIPEKIRKEMEDLYNKYMDRYPFLNLYISEEQVECIIEYINAIDLYHENKKKIEVLNNDDMSTSARAA